MIQEGEDMNINYIILGVIIGFAIIEIYNGFIMTKFNQNIKEQKRAADAKHTAMNQKRMAMFDLENHTKLIAKGGKRK